MLRGLSAGGSDLQDGSPRLQPHLWCPRGPQHGRSPPGDETPATQQANSAHLLNRCLYDFCKHNILEIVRNSAVFFRHIKKLLVRKKAVLRVSREASVAEVGLEQTKTGLFPFVSLPPRQVSRDVSKEDVTKVS